MPEKATRWWDWLSALLLLALMLTSAGRLGITDWTPDLDTVQRLAVLGALVGMPLGLSRFGRRACVALALGYSLILPAWQFALVVAEDIPLWLDRVTSLGGRIVFSLGEFAASRPVEDTLFFVVLLGVIYWAIGLAAGYWLTRHANFLAVVLPAGLVLMVVQSYDSASLARIWFAGFYIFLSLTLLARLNYLRDQASRREKRIFANPESRMDLTNGAVITAAVLILVAWSLPTAFSRVPAISDRWDRAMEPWNRLRDRLSDAFAALEGGTGVGVEMFGDELALGTGSVLSDEVMFAVTIQSASRDVPRYYWRGRTYDLYENNQWSTSALLQAPFDPEEGNMLVADLEGRRIANFIVQVQKKQFTFYLPPQPVWVSRPGQALLFRVPDGTGDVVWFRSETRLEGGDTFQVRAAIANPTVRQLRDAGEEYPAWVTERYLQLPEDFSPRIRILAQQLTAGKKTPYDKAAAITAYLRSAIEYQPTIPAPPEGADPMEWFLFDLRKGFCNYYASAEVLMLRAVGVPARLAVGYAEGESDDFERKFTAREKDAHAWPEVYFPNIGWVEFEPTSGQDPLERPAGQTSLLDDGRETPPDEGDPDNPADKPGDRTGQEDTPAEIAPEAAFDWNLALRIGGWLAGLIALAALILLDRRNHWVARAPAALRAGLEKRNLDVPGWLSGWEGFSAAGSIARSFETINIGLRLLGEKPPAHATPAQRAGVLSQLLPGSAEAIAALAEEHQAELYSPRRGDAARARQSARAIWGELLPAAARHAWKTIQDRILPG